MRWLTREWWDGDLVGPEYEAASLHYELNLQRIGPSLPLAVHTLSSLDLHDALFDDVMVDSDDGTVTSCLLCGEVERGYVFLTLTYHGARFTNPDLAEVEGLVNNPETEVLLQEVDMSLTGHFEHRLLLWPEGELTIQFSALSLAMEPTRERKRHAAFVRFHES